MDKGRTQTKELKDKEIDEYAQSLTLKRWYKRHVSRKKVVKRPANIKDYVDASIQGFLEFFKKSEEWLITADTSNRKTAKDRKKK